MIWLYHGDRKYWLYSTIGLNKLTKIILLACEGSLFHCVSQYSIVIFQCLIAIWIVECIEKLIQKEEYLCHTEKELEEANQKIICLCEEISGQKRNIDSKEHDIHMKNKYIACLTHDLRNMILAYILYFI